MKIDVTQVLKELDGSDLLTQSKPMKLCDECALRLQELRTPLTLRLVCTRALTAITQETVKLSGQKKFERGQLAGKIYQSDNPTLSVEEISQLKAVIGENEGPLVVVQAYDILDPQEK